MERRTGEEGLDFFSVIDRNGRVVLPQNYFGVETGQYVREKVWNRLREAIGLSRAPLLRETIFDPPCSVIQMLYLSKEKINPQAESELFELYNVLRTKLKRHKRFTGG